ETALHVVYSRAGTVAEREAAAVPVEQARIATPEAGDFGRPHNVTEPDAAPAEVSTTDNDRPILRRGPEAGAAETPTPSSPAAAAPKSNELSSPKSNEPGAIITDAREAAASFSAGLPNFLVQQVTTRYTGSRFVDNWRPLDVVTTDVSSVGGKEEYKNIR